MSTIYYCPFCGSETPQDKKFCKGCGKGLHCPNPECKAPLELGAQFCVECGIPYYNTSITSPTEQTFQANQFDYYSNQQGKNRVVRATLRLSDRAMEAVAPFAFEQLLANQPMQGPLTHGQVGRQKNLQIPPAHPNLFAQEPVQDAEYQEEPAYIPTATSPPANDGVAKYFERNGAFLAPKTKDFKGMTSWADQQRNFIVLYLAAYNQIVGEPVPNKEHFREAASNAGVYDIANFSGKHLNKQVNAFMMSVQGGYKLNIDGEKEVERILLLMDNPESKPGFDYLNRDAGSPADRHRYNGPIN